MTSVYATLVAAAITSFGLRPLLVQRASCAATPSSMTPAGWTAPATRPSTGPRGHLQLVADIPLPGPANRFDYQSVDPAARRLYISHMNAGRLVVVDLDSSSVLADVGLLFDVDQHLLHDLLQAERGPVRLGTADSGKGQQVVDQVARPLGRLQDHRHIA